MKNLIYSIILISLFAACEKDDTMPPSECQQHYNELMDQYNASIDVYTAKLNNGYITYAQWCTYVNSAANSANSQAQALTDCSGWQNLGTIHP